MSEDTSKIIKIIIAIMLAITLLICLTFIINTGFKHEEPLVYITRTGNCYHSADCGYLWSSSIAIGKNQAIDKGYRACSRCGGKSTETITTNNYGASFGIALLVETISAFIGLFIYGKIKKET